MCPFESRKCEKERKKLQKFKYLDNKKSFFRYCSFWRAIIRLKKYKMLGTRIKRIKKFSKAWPGLVMGNKITMKNYFLDEQEEL